MRMPNYVVRESLRDSDWRPGSETYARWCSSPHPWSLHNIRLRLYLAWDVFRGRADALYWSDGQ